MKILEASKVREADKYTIEYEPIEAVNLMERAAWKCSDWLLQKPYKDRKIHIFCGLGNNGGDGLAISRTLADEHYSIHTYTVETGSPRTEEFETNLERLDSLMNVRLSDITKTTDFPNISPDDIVIDCLFGSGLSRPVVGMTAELIAHINNSKSTVISIDIPSGLFGEDNYLPFQDTPKPKPIIEADYTLTFEFPFLSFFLHENEPYVGQIVILPIGIHPNYIQNVKSQFESTEHKDIIRLVRQRQKFSHKGNFGHALLLAGSYGKMGAATMAARGCLRAGVGLLTAQVPRLAYDIMQTSVPEAMTNVDQHDYQITSVPDTSTFSAIGIGPGLGTKTSTEQSLKDLLHNNDKPLVIDADGINILAKYPEWLDLIPKGSVLTPHPKEFERLFGKTKGANERLKLQCNLAIKYQVVIVLKGAHTSVASPSGKCYFNTTGNPGMATAGSGDVLTGVILSLLAQEYSATNAAILGVYMHGLAGDLAAKKTGTTALIASDIIDHLGAAFLQFEEQ